MAVGPNLAIISGEMSGDKVGGALARAIHSVRPDIALWGMGSHHMAQAGVDVVYDSSAWSSIGVVEALRVFPMLKFKVFPGLTKQIKARRPDAVVLIDFGAFNIHVAKVCKRLSVPVLYYFPPGSWRTRGKVNPEIARITDFIATPFGWSADRLKQVGANVEFVGHPLLDLAKPSLSREQFAQRFGMNAAKPIVGFLPGSRSFEIEHNTPPMLGAAQQISAVVPEAQFVFGLASQRARDQVEGCLQAYSALSPADKAPPTEKQPDNRRESARTLVTPEGVTVSPDALKGDKAWLKRAQGANVPPVVLAENLTYDVMAHSDALVICSGTATLEAAIFGTPMVIIYRGSRLMELEAKVRRVRPEHIGMPNIIAQSRIMPELIQHDASPDNIAREVLRWLSEPDTRAKGKADLMKVRDALGSPGASERTALAALKLAGLI